jgi:hypothetical protein
LLKVGSGHGQALHVAAKLNKGRLLGRFFAASRDRLHQTATALGVHHLANLGGCAAQ